MTDRFVCLRCDSDTFYVVTSDNEWSLLRCAVCEAIYDLDYSKPGGYRS